MVVVIEVQADPVGQGENDRRRILVSLSETARPAVAEMRRRNAEPVISFLRQLDEDQAEAFIGNLALLLDHLRTPPGV